MLYVHQSIKPKPNLNSLYSLTAILSVSPPFPLPVFHGFKTLALQLANADSSKDSFKTSNFWLSSKDSFKTLDLWLSNLINDK